MKKFYINFRIHLIIKYIVERKKKFLEKILGISMKITTFALVLGFAEP